MTTTSKLIAAGELLRLPRGEGERYELIRGVLVEKWEPETRTRWYWFGLLPHWLTMWQRAITETCA